MKKIIVALHSGGFYEVDEKQADNLSNVISIGSAKFIKIDGQHVAISSISNLMDADKYFEQHPKKKKNREPFYKNFSELEEPKTSYSEERHKSKLEKMKAGFLKGAKVKTKEDLSEGQGIMFNSIESKLLKIEV